MAITTSAAILYDGLKNFAVMCSGVSDGSGAERGETKVDSTALIPVGLPSVVKINTIQYSVRLGSVQLSWGDANSPVPFMVLSGSGTLDYRRFGGLQNGAPDPNGNILLDTIGFETNSAYSLTVEGQK